MATTDVLVFARTTSQITTQANYITLSPAGNLAGSIADAFLENKCLRQVSTVAATLTLFLANATGNNITDDTTVMTVANLTPFFNSTIPTLQGNNNFSANGSMNLPNTIGGIAGSATNNAIIYSNDRWQAGNIVPRGVIWMWSGAINSLPVGWQLCDGTNGSPDLRDRFIVGAGRNYSIGNTGGSATVIPQGAVSGTTAGTALTEDQMPRHWHRMVGPFGTRNVQGGEFGFGNYGGGTPDDTAFAYGTWSTGQGAPSGNSNTIGSNDGSPHAHDLQATFTGASTPNLPPYYALAFIFKT